MCGRYALALRPSEVRYQLETAGLPVDEAPDDDATRQSYNVAPGYYELVYRADVPDSGAGGRTHDQKEAHHDEAAAEDEQGQERGDSDDVKYKLQAMKWGLIPFWTKRNPDYRSMLKTINCRDDSLIENRGMWNTMKQKKRCVIIFQGFYEWLKKNGGKEKIPHFVKPKDSRLMCVAGLWDCVQYEDSAEKLYTYTIITTDSNEQLKFLHDRMPVILDQGSEAMRVWLDPSRSTWSKELQSLLRPYQGELEVYPVSKEVGKVGNNSPAFIVPIASSENKQNIASFFANKKEAGPRKVADQPTEDIEKKASSGLSLTISSHPEEDRKTIKHEGTENNAPLPVPVNDDGKSGVKTEHEEESKTEVKRESPNGDENESKTGLKRKHEDMSDAPDEDSHQTKSRRGVDPGSAHKEKSPKSSTPGRKTRSATKNGTALPSKKMMSPRGSRKITSFFGQ